MHESKYKYYNRYRYLLQETGSPATPAVYLSSKYIGKGRNGVSVPGWKGKIKHGIDATSPFDGWDGRFESKCEPLVAGSTYFKGAWFSYPSRSTLYGDWAAPFVSATNRTFDDQSGLSSARNAALQRFITQAKNHQHEFAGGVFMGEFAENFRLISDLAKGLYGLTHGHLSALNQIGHSVSKGSRLKAAADLWLTYSFGVKPLMSDIEDAVQAFKNKANGRKSSYIYGRGHSESASTPQTHSDSAGPCSVYVTNVIRQTCSVVFRGVVRHELYTGSGVLSQDLKSFAQHYGFDMDSWVPTAWELVPWSFLVDYFTNIGNLLDAIYFRRSSLCWVSETTRTEVSETSFIQLDADSTLAGLNHWPSEDGYCHGGPGFSRITGRAISRRAPGSLIPDLVFELPSLPTQWLNMLALAATHDKIPLPF